MCNCKKELEAKLTERFAEHQPLATEHSVELRGYGLAVVGSTVTLRPYMQARAEANFLLKNGGRKHRVINQTMVFSFCPFCGERIDRSAVSA